MFLTPLPKSWANKFLFVGGFALSVLLGLVVFPFVAIYDFLWPEKVEEHLNWDEDSDEEENEDTEETRK